MDAQQPVRARTARAGKYLGAALAVVALLLLAAGWHALTAGRQMPAQATSTSLTNSSTQGTANATSNVVAPGTHGRGASSSASSTTSSSSFTTSVATSSASTSASSTASTSSVSTSASTSTVQASILPGQCATPTDPNYTLQYTTNDWYIYAYNSTWNEYKNYYLSQINYPDQVYGQLSSMLGLHLPKAYLLINQQTGGGYATSCVTQIGAGPGIAIAYDAWFHQYSGIDNWSIELIAHESTNMFTGYVVSGWPRDWWADDKSPFPYATKILVEETLGHTDAANASRASADPLTQMYLSMYGTYGTAAFQRLFADITADGWTQWFGPNPSQNLGDYVAAYLSIAMGSSQVSTINAAFANEGTLTYTINATAVNDIIARRNALQGTPTSSSCWNLFRSGDFNASC